MVYVFVGRTTPDVSKYFWQFFNKFKDTHGEKAASNKTPALSKTYEYWAFALLVHQINSL